MKFTKKLLAATITAALAGVTQGVYAKNDKVDICHNGHVINVAQPAVVAAHLAHGDTEGACPEPTVEESASTETPVGEEAGDSTSPEETPTQETPTEEVASGEPEASTEEVAAGETEGTAVEESGVEEATIEESEASSTEEAVVEKSEASTEEVVTEESETEEVTAEESEMPTEAEETVAEESQDPREIEDIPPVSEIEEAAPAEPTHEEIVAQLLTEAETLVEASFEDGFLLLPEVQVSVFGFTFSYAVVLEEVASEDNSNLIVAAVKEVESREGVVGATYSLENGEALIPMVNVAEAAMSYYDVVLAVVTLDPLEFAIESFSETSPDEAAAEEEMDEVATEEENTEEN